MPCVRIWILLVGLLLSLPGAAFAQAASSTGNTPATIPDSPRTTESDAKKIPLFVEHDGSDVVGIRLAYQLKEMINTSSRFNLKLDDGKKIVLAIESAEEFGDRPKLSSVYSVSWLYSSKDGALKYYLTSDVGIVDRETVTETVEALLTKTDRVANTYSYLFD
ncbi:hypothetical protein [Desulfovibrio inopinatus]|uniref:hypothetical protein n=1 Tax=Desulfovibrio inopinatus TaxID=102109 RepID=UPI00041B06B2|nr:hypothetical protein [Desulfovibrio inopinatus]